MGSPACCNKIGIKKGPWTPEEDIILVSYIQQHGPGHWRLVPTSTGLMRCSKSCRLRWTNYLRPGIKRGNFTPREEAMIIHLQALLGNKWAAIATYLPQRTDNDIKNYWNTHLKKRIKKYNKTSVDNTYVTSSDSVTSCHLESPPNGYFTNIRIQEENTPHPKLPRFFNSSSTYASSSSTYASSTENISRLLEGWMKSSTETTIPKTEQQSDAPVSNDELDSLLSFENLGCIGWEKSSADSTHNAHQSALTDDQPPLSQLEKWLFDEATGQVEGLMELSEAMF